MPPPRGKGRFSKDRRPKRNQQSLLFRRKRFCRFTVAGVEEIDYKEIDVLRDFISENGELTLLVSHQAEIHAIAEALR